MPRKTSPPPRRRVLVIDDHRESRFVMCHALEVRGYVCKGVGTVSSALSALEAFCP